MSPSALNVPILVPNVITLPYKKFTFKNELI